MLPPGLGHVHVAPDSDGVVRSLYLLEGPAAAPWHHFSTALQCVADWQPAATCGHLRPLARQRHRRQPLAAH